MHGSRTGAVNRLTLPCLKIYYRSQRMSLMMRIGELITFGNVTIYDITRSGNNK